MNEFLRNLFDTIRMAKRTELSNLKYPIFQTNVINNEIHLILSLYDYNNSLYMYQGRGETFQTAIESALDTYYNYKIYKPQSIRIDIIKDIRPAKKSDPFLDIKNDRILFKTGIDGLAVGKNLDALFLPEEVLLFNLIKDQKFQVKNIKEAFNKHYHLPSGEKFIDSLNRVSLLEIYKIRTDTYYIDDYSINNLNYLSSLAPQISKDAIMEAIILTKDNYFKNVVNKKGKYIYSYLPWEGVKEKRYNILRHAGTTYSILETFELTGDKELLKICEGAIQFLLEKIINYEFNGKSVNVVVEKDIIKLGGNALTIIALAKYTQITGDTKFLPLMQSMAEWMVVTQNEEGRFTIHKQQYSTGKIYDFISHYYPGEAMLALVRLYQIDGNEIWLDIAEKSAYYLIEIRDKNSNEDTIAHDHWLLYALNELYQQRPQASYLNHGLLIANAIVKSQILNDGENNEWNGAYLLPEPRLESTPTACRSEGLCAVYQLLNNLDNTTDVTKIKKAIKKAIDEGIRFQLRTQLRPEKVMFYNNKKLCLGAFQRGLYKYDLRIDYTQHNISSLISYYKLLTHKIKNM
ncbi:glycoside hydrolase family 88 protein [Alkaliphilus peptidifermentans]|uniref:Uncharacterized protein n=1 Tax=Alkaliphilus peptidifermentans DSM 18978 TaxID=1120976 RepID=A0A1G5BWC3_9FIRM|nr:hypothetical protein [Alkaliphilus peptidifermentans]SCX94344.1 hypothetical protein SAMN03080606_00541 [Alkaliphilus peptidifermentans DSM 18978]